MKNNNQKQIIDSELAHIDGLTGAEFELYMVKILNNVRIYHNVKHTPQSNDHGLDAIGYDKENRKIGWQFKNYKDLVPFHSVEEAVFGMLVYDTEVNIVLTNSYFSQNTIRLCKKINNTHPSHQIHLINRKDLADLIKAYKLNEPWIKIKQERKAKKEVERQQTKKQRQVRRTKNLEYQAWQPFYKGIKWSKQMSAISIFKEPVKQFAFYTLKQLAPLIGYYSRDRVNHLKQDLCVNKSYIAFGPAFDKMELDYAHKSLNPYQSLTLIEHINKTTYVYYFAYFDLQYLRKIGKAKIRMIQQHRWKTLRGKYLHYRKKYRYPRFFKDTFGSGLFWNSKQHVKHFFITNAFYDGKNYPNEDFDRHKKFYRNIPYIHETAYDQITHFLDYPDRLPKPQTYDVFDFHTLWKLTYPTQKNDFIKALDLKRDKLITTDISKEDQPFPCDFKEKNIKSQYLNKAKYIERAVQSYKPEKAQQSDKATNEIGRNVNDLNRDDHVKNSLKRILFNETNTKSVNYKKAQKSSCISSIMNYILAIFIIGLRFCINHLGLTISAIVLIFCWYLTGSLFGGLILMGIICWILTKILS